MKEQSDEVLFEEDPEKYTLWVTVDGKHFPFSLDNPRVRTRGAEYFRSTAPPAFVDDPAGYERFNARRGK